MIKIDIVVEKDFVITEFAGVVDLARVSNRILAKELFTWKCYSQQGGVISSSSGASVETEPVPEKPFANYVVFMGNKDPAYQVMDVVKYVKRYSYAGSKIILLAEAASRYIQQNSMNASDHTTHWENRILLEEKHGIYGIKSELATTHGNIITSAGMLSTVDMMLSVLRNHISSEKLQTLTKIFLNDTIRKTDTQQSEAGKFGYFGSDNVGKATKLMLENLEEPLSILEISKRAGQTTRSLERAFKSRMGCSPSAYYREIRLNHAHNLLVNTNMTNTEIANACGFSTGFSSAYKKVFGKTPYALRRSIA